MKQEFVSLLFLLLLKRYSHGAANEFTLRRRANETVPGPTLLFDKRVKLNSGTLEFQFKTFVENALVLYQDDEGYSNYIEITLQNGKVAIVYDVGGKKYLNGSQNTYNDFRWHYMKLERTRGMMKLILPDEVMELDTSNLEPSQFTSPLQIGGFPTIRYREPNTITSQSTLEFFFGKMENDKIRFFNSCIKNIRYTPIGGQPKPIQDAISLKHFAYSGTCKLTQCDRPKPPCNNRGLCSVKNSKVRCNCRWTGYEGEKCKQRALQLYLNGTYSVKYLWKNKPISSEQEEFKFRIKTRQSDAVIMKLRSDGQIKDKLTFEIRRKRLMVTVNLGSQKSAYLWLGESISDGKWHVVHYKRLKRKFTVMIDNREENRKSRTTKDTTFTKLDYGGLIHIGERKHKYRYKVLLQDFIWSYPKQQEVDFIRTLFKWFHNHRVGNYKYEIDPKYILPAFNRKLPSQGGVMKPLSTPKTTTELCTEDGEVACKKTGATSKVNTVNPKKSARTGEDEDSSITWIIVVTVICSLILFAVIAFLVYRWNKRYSGDFQINKKEIGPSGTVVHYKDTCYKEKQRPTKI